MVSVVETRFVLLYALYTDGEAFACKSLSGDARRETAMESIDNEGPVHHLVAVEEVTIENEFESSILAILSIGRVVTIKFQL